MTSRKHWLTDLLLLSGSVGSFYAYKLGERALWSPGEGRYSEIAREMLASGNYLTPQLVGVSFFDKPPFFIWLETLSIKLFGLNEWALRLWPALLAVVGCLIVYIAGRKLFGRSSGVISAYVLATSGLWYGIGHLVSLDMTLSVLMSCSLLCFLLATNELPGCRRRGLVWGFFLCAALATLTKGLIGIVFPAMIIGAWLMFLGDWTILATLYPVSGALLFLLIVLPWHILVARSHPGFLSYYFFDGQVRRFLTDRHGLVSGPWTFIPVLILGLFPWSAFLIQALRKCVHFNLAQMREQKEALFLTLWAATVFLFFSLSSYQDIPYILPVFPPLALLIGRYFAEAWDKPDLSGIRTGYWILIFGLSLFALVSLAGPQHYLERFSNWPSLEAPSEEGRIVSTHRTEYKDLAGLTPYLALQSTILIVAALATCATLRRHSFSSTLMSVSAAWALFLLVVTASLPVLDARRSIKSLALPLYKRLQPMDEVATYHTYYQDLPVYLQRPVIIVQWPGELQFGIKLTRKSTSWLVDDATFWRRWDTSARIYLLADRANYRELAHQPHHRVFMVAETPYDVLITNHQTGFQYATVNRS